MTNEKSGILWNKVLWSELRCFMRFLLFERMNLALEVSRFGILNVLEVQIQHYCTYERKRTHISVQNGLSKLLALAKRPLATPSSLGRKIGTTIWALFLSSVQCSNAGCGKVQGSVFTGLFNPRPSLIKVYLLSNNFANQIVSDASCYFLDRLYHKYTEQH